MPVKGWMHYDTISVKWDHQVVATKRDKTVEVEQEYNPEEDEQADNVQTMRVSDDSRAPVNKMVKESKGARESKNLEQSKSSGDQAKGQEKPPEKKGTP